MTAPTASEHLDDGDLLRLVDGEAGDDRAVIERHLAACAACVARLDTLRAESAAVSAALAAELDDESVALPATLTWSAVQRAAAARASGARASGARPWLRRTEWRVAATVLVAAAGIAVAAPAAVRWTHRRAVASSTTAAASVATAPAATARTAARLSVGGLASRDLVVEFAARPGGGSLQIVADSGDTFAMDVLGARPDDARLDVLPGRLVVHNAAASTASYRLRVPRTLRSLSVRVAGAAALLTTGAALDGRPRTIGLAR